AETRKDRQARITAGFFVPEGFQAVSWGCRESDGICWYFCWYLARMPSQEPAGTNKDERMLTDTAIRKAKPAVSPLKLSDGGGLYLLLKPDGGRYWRLNYRFGGKQKTLALGVYPTVTLADARQRREDARKLLANGTDPGEMRKEAKQAQAAAAQAEGDTFEAIAREWMARQDVAEVTANKSRWILESFLFPEIGSLTMAAITPRVLLDALRKVEAT